MNKEKKNILVFGYGLALIATVFAVLGTIKHGMGPAQVVELVCAVLFSVVTWVQWEALKPGYALWMKGAHFIGGIVTAVILGTVFFCIFAPIGILFRMIGKDHLERTIDKAASTYWHLRPEPPSSAQRYHQQF